jgi:hypothetical protein
MTSGDVPCVLDNVDCLTGVFLGLCCVSFLCDYCVQNWVVGNGVVVVEVMILFAGVVYVEFLHAVHMFSFPCVVSCTVPCVWFVSKMAWVKS